MFISLIANSLHLLSQSYASYFNLFQETNRGISGRHRGINTTINYTPQRSVWKNKSLLPLA